jgi:hypothetical protein
MGVDPEEAPADNQEYLDYFRGFLAYNSPKRQKLSQYNTIDNVVSLLRRCSWDLIITGAGISTSLGIPDFRSKNTGMCCLTIDQLTLG